MNCTYSKLSPTFSQELWELLDKAELLGIAPKILEALFIAPLISNHIAKVETVAGQRLDTFSDGRLRVVASNIIIISPNIKRPKPSRCYKLPKDDARLKSSSEKASNILAWDICHFASVLLCGVTSYLEPYCIFCQLKSDIKSAGKSEPK